MKTAVIYARYSSAGQRDTSIDDQIKVCRQFCEREGIEVLTVYADAAKTGTNANRPDFQRMIKNAPESDYVVVYKLDRFSRNKYDAPLYKGYLAERDVKVLSATEGIPQDASGLFLESLLEAQAAFYSASLSENVRRGLDSNAEKCMANGIRVFGYDIDADGHYVVNEDEALLVQDAFEKRLNGEGIADIKRYLNAHGARTTTGAAVTYGFASKMIKDRRYLGEYRFGKHLTIGGMPRIIDDETFDAVQHIPPRPKRRNAQYRLTGKLTCDKCGMLMHGETAKNRHGKYFHYYRCRRGNGCSRPSVRANSLERAIYNEVEALLNNPDTCHEIAERLIATVEPSKGSSADEVSKLLAENAKARQNVAHAIEAGAELGELLKRAKELERERELLERELQQSNISGLTVEDVEEFLLHGFDFNDADIVLESFVSHVYMFDDEAVAVIDLMNEPDRINEVRIKLNEVDGGICETESLESVNRIQMVASQNMNHTLIMLRGAFALRVKLAT